MPLRTETSSSSPQVVSRIPPSAEGPATVNVIIHCQLLDFGSFASGYVDGVRVATPSTYAVSRQSPQSTPKETRQRLYFLMDNAEGSITECRGGNFMFVHSGRIKLPDRRHVLPGISMHTILELADSLGVPVDEDDYCIHDVYVADEAFVSSTRHCLVPVDTVNGLRLAGTLPGPVTQTLIDAWRGPGRHRLRQTGAGPCRSLTASTPHRFRFPWGVSS